MDKEFGKSMGSNERVQELIDTKSYVKKYKLGKSCSDDGGGRGVGSKYNLGYFKNLVLLTVITMKLTQQAAGLLRHQVIRHMMMISHAISCVPDSCVSSVDPIQEDSLITGVTASHSLT